MKLVKEQIDETVNQSYNELLECVPAKLWAEVWEQIPEQVWTRFVRQVWSNIKNQINEIS